MDKQKEKLYEWNGQVAIKLEKIEDLLETKNYEQAKEIVKQLKFKYYRIMCF